MNVLRDALRFNRCFRLVVVFSLLSACQPPDELAQTNKNAPFALQVCTADQFAHRGNRKDFQCGTLSVPENPEAPDGRLIPLNIVRLPALSSSAQADPVFVLAGGPGQASTEIVASISPWLRKVNRERDFVFVDQRGTGKSHPLDCISDDEVDPTLNRSALLQLQQQLMQNCLQDYDADLRYYTTPFAADDINQVRDALGYEKINLWGASYGTRLALEIMRRHPTVVRAAVLDSVAPVGIHLPEFLLADADRSLQKLIDLCEQEMGCATRFPELENQIKNLISNLDSEPRLLSLTHPLRGEEFTLRLDGQLVAGLLRLGLYVRDISPTMPLMIDAAAKGDFAPLLTLYSMSEEVEEGISIGLQHTILCAEDVARIESADKTENSLLQLRAIAEIKRTCEFWPQGLLPNDYFQPVVSDIPTLLLSGNLDPVTPPRWGNTAAATLSRHLHIQVAGAHHNVSHLGCVPDLIDDFYATTQVDKVDTTCVENIQPLPPFVSAAGPLMQTENAVKQEPAKKDTSGGP